MPSSYLCLTSVGVDVAVTEQGSSAQSHRASMSVCRSLSVTSNPISSESVTSNLTYSVTAIFGRPFVKRLALCYQTVVGLSLCPVLSVTLVYCGQTVGWINMKLGMQVGLGPDHIVLHGDPAPRPPKVGRAPQFSAHVCCGQVAGLIKMPLVREVGLSPSDNVLDGDPAPLPKRRRSPPPPNFRPMSVVTRRLDGSRCHLAWN